ncbi:MAG: hypothetical protein RL283_26 [Actinomycetota bacterium]
MRVGVVGAGVVGARAAEALVSLGADEVVVHDERPEVAAALAARLGGGVRVGDPLGSGGRDDAGGGGIAGAGPCEAVVLATRAPQRELAVRCIGARIPAVTTSDDAGDVLALLGLDDAARAAGVALVVGAAASPGLTGLLAARLAAGMDEVDEVHVAMHGTGGPACSRQHHRALAGQSVGWHDGEWLRRPAGSGRELCWFPEPVGGRDCYRVEHPDPLVLKRAFPRAARITTRMSATRRDRLVARLPMMIPPHAEGGVGAVRVEVRGRRGGGRGTEILGVAERVGQLAGIVAAVAAATIVRGGIGGAGARVLGAPGSPHAEMLAWVESLGVRVQEFVGSEG